MTGAPGRHHLEQLISQRRFRAVAEETNDDVAGRALLAMARGGPLTDIIRGAQETTGRIAAWCVEALRSFDLDPSAFNLVDGPVSLGSPLHTYLDVTKTIARTAPLIASGMWKAARLKYAGLLERYPDADEASEWLTTSALLAACDGDLEATMEALRAAAARDPSEKLRATIAAMHERIDEAEDVDLTQPAWRHLTTRPWAESAAVDTLRASATGRQAESGDNPALAGQIASVLGDLDVVRCEATEETIDTLLAAEVAPIVFLDDGQIASRRNVIGYDPVWRIVLLFDSGDGLLLPWKVFRRRTAHSSHGLVAAFGRDASAQRRQRAAMEAGLADDERYREVDEAVAGGADRIRSDARIRKQLDSAIGEAPDFEYGRLYHLAALARLVDQNDPSTSREFTRTAAECRARFRDAAWPIRLYAQILERLGRWDEAYIAWSDHRATRDDEVAALTGLARCTQDHDEARELGRKVLTLRPKDLDTIAQHAERLSMMRDVADGRPTLDLLEALDPDRPGLVAMAADMAEAAGDFDRSHALLHTAAAAGDGYARSRAYWAGLRIPDPAAARSHADNLLSDYRSAPEAWQAAVWLGWVEGDHELMWETMRQGLQIVGLGPLQGMATSLLKSLTPSDLIADRSAVLGTYLQPDHHIFIRGLATSRLNHVAVTLMDDLVAANPNNAELHHWRARILLEAPRGADRRGAAQALRRAIELAPNWDFGPVMLAHLVVDADPEESLRLLDDRNLAVSPLTAWSAAASALRRLGRADEATALEARYAEAYPGGLVEEAPIWRELGRSEQCLELLLQATALYPDDVALVSELVRTYDKLGRPAEIPLLPRHLIIDPRSEHGLASDACARTGAWDVLAEVAGGWLARWRSADQWDATAAASMQAIAGAAVGNEDEYDRMARALPRHPGRLRAVAVAAQGGFGDAPRAHADLEMVAPGELLEIGAAPE